MEDLSLQELPKDSEGNSYYFNKLSFRKRVYELNIGAKVEFIVAKSFDKKKGERIFSYSTNINKIEIPIYTLKP